MNETANLPIMLDAPIKLQVITDEPHEVRPCKLINIADHIAELATCAPGSELNIRPRRERRWWHLITDPLRDRTTIAHLLRLHP